MSPANLSSTGVFIALICCSIHPTNQWASPWPLNSAATCSSSEMTTYATCVLQGVACNTVTDLFFTKNPVKVMSKCGTQVVNSGILKFYGLEMKGPGLATLLTLDNSTSAALNKCFLNTSKLLSYPDMSLNRTALSLRLVKLKLPPQLLIRISSAITTCPEPVDYQMTPFIQCLSDACMSDFVTTPNKDSGQNENSVATEKIPQK